MFVQMVEKKDSNSLSRKLKQIGIKFLFFKPISEIYATVSQTASLQMFYFCQPISISRDFWPFSLSRLHNPTPTMNQGKMRYVLK